MPLIGIAIKISKKSPNPQSVWGTFLPLGKQILCKYAQIPVFVRKFNNYYLCFFAIMQYVKKCS